MQKTSEAEIYLFLLRFNGFQPDPRKQPDILTKRISEAFSDDRDFLSTVMLLDQLNYLVDDNLVKVDRSAMSVSLETRLPLLDRKVVELSWRIDPALKLNQGQTKWPLREILYQHVPKHLIERPKMGFSVPLSRWLGKELHCKVDGLLADSSMAPLIDLEHYRVLWAQHRRGERDNGLLLWPMIILLQWLRANSEYIEIV
jgi:asparagine synthase (glutamine-hydrolysing)